MQRLVSYIKETRRIRLTVVTVFMLLPLLIPSLTAGADPVIDVSAGFYHTCGLNPDGTVACWGAGKTNTGVIPEYGQSTPPAGTFIAVSAGDMHTCGVKTDETVACWGWDYSSQSTPAAGTFTEVSAGGHHTCGLKTDGTVACWGNNFDGQSTPPAGTFTEVSVGVFHSCGVETKGTVVCWGNDDYGRSTPPAEIFTEVSAGNYHTCGLKTDGTVACWGSNFDGQSTPPTGAFTAISAGGYHTCGVKKGGGLSCWGRNTEGQSTPPVGRFTVVSAGGYHTCGVKIDGTAFCWGDNNYGAAPVVTISPIALPARKVGFPYSQTITASGGLSPYSFKKISGSIPPGITLTDKGKLRGSPGSIGDFTFTVQAVDKNNISGKITYTLKVTANTPPTIGSLTPGVLISEQDAAETFTAIYSDTDGHSDIKQACLRVHTKETKGKDIYLKYDVTSDKLFLYNDAGTTPVGSCTPGVAGTLANTQGTLDCLETTVSGSGNDLTVDWVIIPKAAFTSEINKNMYLFVRDLSDETAGWTDKGDWTVRAANVAPTLGSLTPLALTSPQGVAKTFTAIYSDADGYADIKQAYLRVHARANGIYLRYDQTTNELYLYNDAGTAAVGSCKPGVAVILTNTQGSLNCATTKVAGSDNNLTIKWNINPMAAFASATTRDLFMLARDMSNLATAWTDKGDWTITP